MTSVDSLINEFDRLSLAEKEQFYAYINAELHFDSFTDEEMAEFDRRSKEIRMGNFLTEDEFKHLIKSKHGF